MIRRMIGLATVWLAASVSAVSAECLPPYAPQVLGGMYPDADPLALGLSQTPDGCITMTGWSLPGTAPTPAEITAAAPPILRALCAGKLNDTRRAAMDARRAETWSGLSAGEVSEAISAGEPSPEIVADYLADRATLLTTYQSQVVTANTLGADAAFACAQTGVLP